MIMDTDTQSAIYIEVTDGKYTGGRGYIMRENPPGTLLCKIWFNGMQIEISLNRSQYSVIKKL